jgi:hypothetical protein
MSVTSVTSNTSSTIGNAILQQLLGTNGSTQDTAGLSSGTVGDVLSLSTAGQQLAAAPTAVTQAMSDILSGQANVTTDLTTLQGYFKQNPDSLTSVLDALQGNTSTYSSSGTVSAGSSTSSILAALAGGKGSTADRTALLSLLGNQTQDPLLASLGGSSSSTTSGVMSLFG